MSTCSAIEHTTASTLRQIVRPACVAQPLNGTDGDQTRRYTANLAGSRNADRLVAPADVLYREWQTVGVQARLVEPSDTTSGLRESAHLDPDDNCLHFRSSTAGPAQ